MISIIIPCFNGFKLMQRCFTALEQQSYKDFEVIIIDDCSSDNSYETIQKYMENSKLNIKLFKNKTNVGPGKSREIGLEKCSGSWVAFCDCDDWYENDFLERMLELSNRNNADLVICDSFNVKNKRKKITGATKKIYGKNKKEELIAFAPMSLWRLLISKTLISKVDFLDIYYSEDGIILTQLILFANKIVITNAPYYNYLSRKDSASSKPSKRAYLDNMKGYYFLEKFLKNNYPEEYEFIGIKYVLYSATIGAYKAAIPVKEVGKIVDDFCGENPLWTNNKYLNSLNIGKRCYLFCLYRRWYILGKIMVYIQGLIIGM